MFDDFTSAFSSDLTLCTNVLSIFVVVVVIFVIWTFPFTLIVVYLFLLNTCLWQSFYNDLLLRIEPVPRIRINEYTPVNLRCK